MKQFKLSEEQNVIIKCDSDFININAFAGTGKTTTLLNYALLHPKQSFLYICYNKVIQLHAEKIFPSNVKVKTSHSLAYGYVGHFYRHKLKAFITPKNIMDCLSALNVKIKDPVTFSNLIIKTLENFCYSQEKVISESHLPLELISTILPIKHLEAGKQAVIKYSTYVFGRMMDVKHDMPITHDGYMKVFQLNIDSFNLKFDTIMLDEAQDANPVLLDIIQHLNAKKIFVGDSYQSIYCYRGAFNALKNNNADNFYLTNSFRFGSDVADCVNVLFTLSGEFNEIKGSGQTNIMTSSRSNKSKRIVLFRNNAAVIDKIYNDDNDRLRYYLEGGMDSYGFNELEELLNIKNGKKSNHHLFGHFNDLDEIKEQAELLENKPLLNKCDTIEKIKTISQFNRIKNRIQSSEKYADVFLSNTHKVKGKEFDSVELYSDFCSPLNPNFSSRNGLEDSDVIHHITPEFQEETNIAYVALTRVKKTLYIPPEWDSWINILKKSVAQGISQRDYVLYTPEAKKLINEKIKLKKGSKIKPKF